MFSGSGSGKRQDGVVLDSARDEEQEAYNANKSFLYPPHQQNPNPYYDHGDEHLRSDYGGASSQGPATVPVPDGPPPMYMEGDREKAEVTQAQQQFKYDPVSPHLCLPWGDSIDIDISNSCGGWVAF
jgi:hypothetical protein